MVRTGWLGRDQLLRALIHRGADALPQLAEQEVACFALDEAQHAGRRPPERRGDARHCRRFPHCDEFNDLNRVSPSAEAVSPSR
jgi:hypothetical protein